jgi:hypothetical protein
MRWLARLGGLLLALTISAPRLEAIPPETLDGISFAEDPHMLFVPVEEIASALRWEMQLDQERISLNGHVLDAARLRKLTNGTLLVPLDELQRAGAMITWSDDGMQAVVASDYTEIAISFAEKRVEVDLANQRLRAYQGARLVLDSTISSGREGKKTPSGEFKAGPVKSRMHRSRLYHNAPMPWSVQVHENIFIHGFRKVPRRPSSHGCIRLPLTGANPANGLQLDRSRHPSASRAIGLSKPACVLKNALRLFLSPESAYRCNRYNNCVLHDYLVRVTTS